MKIGVVGSRNFRELDKVRGFVGGLGVGDVVVSGGAIGVDTVAVEVASGLGLEVVVFEADWKGLGKKAGVLRNRELVGFCDKVVVFWNGVSKGSENVIELCKVGGVKCEVVLEDNGQLGLWG